MGKNVIMLIIELDHVQIVTERNELSISKRKQL